MNALKFWKTFFMSMIMVRMAEGDGGGDGGSSFSQEDLDNAVTAANAASDATHSRAVEGLKSKNTTLLSEKKGIADKLALYGDMDPDKIGKMLKQFSNDEDAQLFAEGKGAEVVERRMKEERAKYGTEITTLTEANNTLLSENNTLKTAHQTNVVNTALRTAAEESDVLAGAIDDVLARGNVVFSINADGKLVAVNADGEPLLSKDGKELMSPKVFVEELKAKVPHYWGESVGSGQRPPVKGGKATDILTKMEAAAESGDMTLYRQLRAQRNKQMAG